MKNTFGNNINITIFGESHGAAIGLILDGLKPGIEIDDEYISKKLSLRRPYGKISTSRREKDLYSFSSGVFNGKTTGTPLCILIPNENTQSKDYEATRFLARPGHADYTAMIKYKGFQDYRGGGHFSGRITAALVAGGAIVQKYLEEKGIYIGTHISRLSGINDAPFTDYQKDISYLNEQIFATISETAGKDMIKAVETVAAEGDSIGGILETAVTGLPAGLGDPFFDSAESMLSHALFSVPGVKGIEFGAGFSFADMKGSEANDSFYVENATVKTRTNNNGGINGGITNGMPVLFRLAIKPTPSIFKKQDTINMDTMTNDEIELQGRHDPAIIHRARVVVDSVTALVIYDMLQNENII